MLNRETISPKTIALLWWVEAFWKDYEEYALALFSDIEDKKKERKVLKFLMENKKYYEYLELKVKNNNYIPTSVVSREISNFIRKVSFEISKFF